jgi:hypothetical protein
MIKKLNTPTAALICLLGFIWLSYAALHHQPVEHGYTHSVFDVLPKTLQQRQAEILMELWHISAEEINQPIRLFGKE